MIHLAEIVVGSSVGEVLLKILGFAVGLVIVYYVYIGITMKMARNRNRDPLGWILLSILVSPMLTWVILLLVGDQQR